MYKVQGLCQTATPSPLQGADGRTLVPGWNASRPEPCAHGASQAPSHLQTSEGINDKI